MENIEEVLQDGGKPISIDEFQKNFLESEIKNENIAPGADDAPFVPPPAPEEIPDAGDSALFPETELDQEETKQDRTSMPDEEKTMNASMADMKLRFIISMVDKLLAKGCTKLAREIDEEKWRFDDEDIEMLIMAWKPYMQKHGNKIPDNIELIFVTIWVIGGKLMKAGTIGIQNAKNQKLAKSPEVVNAVRVADAEIVERKKYSIDNNGYYLTHPKTAAYVKVADRVLKADLKDIEKLVEDNDITIIRRAFPNLDTTKYETTAGQGI